MSIEYDAGFKIKHVELFLMDSMKTSSASIAVFDSKNGLVVRKNDIPSFSEDTKTETILIGGVQTHKDDDDVLYELPCFQDNSVDGEVAFTVIKKSDVSREQVHTLFEKL